MNTKYIDILGIDIGHGESAAAFLRGDDDEKSPPQKALDSDITAISYLESEKFVIGSQAILQSGILGTGEFNSLDVCFKSKPGISIQTDKQIADFALGTFQEAIDKCKLSTEDIEVCIGCPSGWNEEERSQYKEIFSERGIPSPSVIRESEAAYAYYFGVIRNSAEYREFTLGELNKLPLILDFGSSTLDATVERRAGEPISDGMPLGAWLIDKAILAWNLEHALDDDYPITPGMKLDFKHSFKKLHDVLKSNKNEYSRALILAREAKQSYWNRKKQYPDIPLEIKPMPDFLPDVRLPLLINDEVMTYILNTPLGKVLPNDFVFPKDPDFIDMSLFSWLECCEKFLDYKFNRRLEQEGVSLDDIGVVVLTGGASLMPPVREVIGSYFLNLEDRLIRYDTEPSLCIAKGLAARARMDLVTHSFGEEVEAYATDKEKGLVKVLIDELTEDAFIKLVSLFGEKLGQLSFSEAKKWQNGDIRKSAIGPNIRSSFRDWSHSSQLTDEIIKILSQVEESICNNINKDLMPIIEKYFNQEVNIMSSTNSPFLTTSYKNIFDRFFREYGLNEDLDIDSGSSLFSDFQDIAMLMSNDFDNTKFPDNLFSDLIDVPTGFGGRAFQFSETKMTAYKLILSKAMKDAVFEIVYCESFMNKISYPFIYSFQAALRRQINRNKYLLYALKS